MNYMDIINKGLDGAITLSEKAAEHTFGRLGAPMEDETKARIYVDHTTAILTTTTGKDVGDRVKLQAYEEALSQLKGNRNQSKATLAKIRKEGITVPEVQIEEKEPLWKMCIMFLMLPVFFFTNTGPFSNNEVNAYLTDKEN